MVMSDPVSGDSITVKQSDLYRSQVTRFTFNAGGLGAHGVSWSWDYPVVVEKIQFNYQNAVVLTGVQYSDCDFSATLYPATMSVKLGQMYITEGVTTDKYLQWKDVGIAFPAGTFFGVYFSSSEVIPHVMNLVTRRVDDSQIIQASVDCGLLDFILRRCKSG
jgi:hypothetical protein